MLHSQNISLRALEPEDAFFIYHNENNTNFWHVSETLSPYSYHQIKHYIETSLESDIYTTKEIRLIICDTEEKQIGIIDIYNIDFKNRRAGIGILITESARNKGYAIESISIVKDYCFKVLNLHQIWCYIQSENTKSIKLFEKSNFSKSGTLKQWSVNSKGTFVDVEIYQCIKF